MKKNKKVCEKLLTKAKKFDILIEQSMNKEV